MVGAFNDFAIRMVNIVHRFQANPEDIETVMGLIQNGNLRPTVSPMKGVMPASCSYDPLDECSS